MHTSSKTKTAFTRISPTDHWSPPLHCSPCTAAVHPWLQLPRQGLREPPKIPISLLNAPVTRKNAGIQAGKGHQPITSTGNILKRSWNFKTLSWALAPAAQTFLMKLQSKLPGWDHTDFCNSLILYFESENLQPSCSQSHQVPAAL